MKKTLYVYRHGNTDFNKKGIFQGSRINSSLNDLGREQAKRFFEKYQHLPFEVVLTSRQDRAIQTAQPFLSAGIPHEIHSGLQEMNWGSLEGRPLTSQDRREVAKINLDWKEGRLESKWPNGDSALDMQLRLRSLLTHIEQRPEQLLLLCTHARTMKCLASLVYFGEVGQSEEFHTSNTGLYILELDTDNHERPYHFLKENDTSHL